MLEIDKLVCKFVVDKFGGDVKLIGINFLMVLIVSENFRKWIIVLL